MERLAFELECAAGAVDEAAAGPPVVVGVVGSGNLAVLWQLGVQYIQGFFVNAPEEVVLGAAAAR